MKNLLLTLILTSTFLFAKPCMTDIYTGNGINTTDKEAWINMLALQNFMLNKASTSSRLDTQKYDIDYSFKYIHNPDHGFNNDMMETYYQLKESGQISKGYFHTMFSLLAGDIPESTLHEKIISIMLTYEEDVNSIYWKYYALSFSQKHNVLLVSHSQGNLIGNKVYTLLSETEKKKFRMISVATPASYVKIKGQTSPYVTAHADLVINNPLIPNHLPTNVAGTGHNFIHTYLDVHSDARHLIASYVKQAYNNLLQTATCNDSYNTVYLTMDNAYSTLTVLGTNREITPVTYDTLASFQLEQLPAEYDIHGNASCKYWVANHMCTNGINNSQCTLNLSEREGGMILSPQDIADYKYFKLSMLHGDTSATVDIADGIYEVVRDALYN
jgi:hypothetical protein